MKTTNTMTNTTKTHAEIAAEAICELVHPFACDVANQCYDECAENWNETMRPQKERFTSIIQSAIDQHCAEKEARIKELEQQVSEFERINRREIDDACAYAGITTATEDCCGEMLMLLSTKAKDSDSLRSQLSEAQKQIAVKDYAIGCAIAAIMTLPEDGLGMASNDERQWPIRNELVSSLKAALSNPTPNDFVSREKVKGLVEALESIDIMEKYPNGAKGRREWANSASTWLYPNMAVGTFDFTKAESALADFNKE